jgi:hypothetical protein
MTTNTSLALIGASQVPGASIQTLNTLPSDVIGLIFSLLPLKSMCNLNAVCKSFYEIYNTLPLGSCFQQLSKVLKGPAKEFAEAALAREVTVKECLALGGRRGLHKLGNVYAQTKKAKSKNETSKFQQQANAALKECCSIFCEELTIVDPKYYRSFRKFARHLIK